MNKKNASNFKSQFNKNANEFEIILSKSDDVIPSIRLLIGSDSQYVFYKKSKISRKMVHRIYTDDDYKMRSDVLIKVITSLGRKLIIK